MHLFDAIPVSKDWGNHYRWLLAVAILHQVLLLVLQELCCGVWVVFDILNDTFRAYETSHQTSCAFKPLLNAP